MIEGSTFDPSDAGQVASAAETMVHVLDAHAALVCEPRPITSATSTWVWCTDFVGVGLPAAWREPTVLRIFRTNEATTAIREDGLSDYLLRHGYPVAETLWRGQLGETHPAVLQHRLDGRPAGELLSGRRLRSVVRGLARLQARLHALPVAGCPVETTSAAEYLEQDLGRRRVLARVDAATNVADPTGRAEACWTWLNDTASRFDSEERVLCHGDFHPMNALVTDDGEIAIVDWTDARLADRHADVARTMALYWFASLIAETAAQRRALRLLRGWLASTHRRAYEQEAAFALDRDRLTWWQVVHLHRGWLQLQELRGGAEGPSSSTLARLPANVEQQLLDRCEALRRSLQ